MAISALCLTAAACTLPYATVFVFVWIADVLSLRVLKISQLCDTCQTNSRYLYYQCSHCFNIHKKLMPDRYGIFQYTCRCGVKIPCTFFKGRDSRNSPAMSVCPGCGNIIFNSGRRIFSETVREPLTLKNINSILQSSGRKLTKKVIVMNSTAKD